MSGFKFCKLYLINNKHLFRLIYIEKKIKIFIF